MPQGLPQNELVMLERAALDALNAVMRNKPDRRAYVVIIAADGPNAGKVFAHSPMPNVIAHQFADALEHESDTVRSSARQGLMATAARNAIARRIEPGHG